MGQRPPPGGTTRSQAHGTKHAGLGVIIPTLNEEAALPGLLSDLSHLEIPHEVVVADGGSRDLTREVATDSGATVVATAPGRAAQMNAGAGANDCGWLLFLHADSRLPAEAREALATWLAISTPHEAGYFGFALEGRNWFWRFIELGQRVRERVAGLVYGDQGLLLSRSLFEKVGGFPELPLMEDVEMVNLLRRVGSVRRIGARLPTSPRRYQAEGRWKGWLRNVTLISLYKLGVSPARLVSLYPAKPPDDSRILLIFAKAPVPGRVKTRLAAAVGEEEAAAIYRTLGRRVVDQVRGGAYRTTVFFDPPQARKTVEAWLGGHRVEFRPQSSGDLGTRLRKAFQWAFQHSQQVVVIGTDAPGLDGELVERAFLQLGRSDLVLGPAMDGGYYLLGLRKPSFEVFEGISWSTEKVLEETRARARSLGLSEALLPPLLDVDTVKDWLEVRDRPHPAVS